MKLQPGYIQFKYPDGTFVELFGVNHIPDGTVAIVDFVDDFGFIFLETPEGLPNVCLPPTAEGIKVKKVTK